jgi:hypothetical protein
MKAMDSESPESKSYQEVLEDHVQLKGLLADIHAALEERADIEQVSRMLAQLGDRIVAHFTLEEDGGYFTEAIMHSPRLVARANRLMAQHPKLSAKARAVIEGAEADQGTETWWQETRQFFDEFREALAQHERGEDELLQEAYTQDIGSND